MSAYEPVRSDVSGKLALVTGANSGVGFEAARALARAGAQVLLGCRDAQRGEAARARIAAEVPSARLTLLPLDLASLASVRAFAQRVREEHSALDLLLNNAGVMAVPRALTEDGFELQLGVNHLGHFALTGLLLELLLAAPEARVVSVSSVMHWTSKVHFDDLDFERRYDPWLAYGQSKLANALFALELGRRFLRSGVRAKSFACHPGYAATNLQFVAPAIEGSRFKHAFFQVGNALFSQNAERGAWPLLHALTAPDLEPGTYIGPGALELWGRPAPAKLSARARDPETAARLWQISVERTGVEYEVLKYEALK